ncbi:hypothetical protein HK096_010355 [Nowakowskiella sp. JEL0078]|nr:hypothetical protein HK096_010355 [Nowakowskiella sp. JEL0078]
MAESDPEEFTQKAFELISLHNKKLNVDLHLSYSQKYISLNSEIELLKNNCLILENSKKVLLNDYNLRLAAKDLALTDAEKRASISELNWAKGKSTEKNADLNGQEWVEAAAKLELLSKENSQLKLLLSTQKQAFSESFNSYVSENKRSRELIMTYEEELRKERKKLSDHMNSCTTDYMHRLRKGKRKEEDVGDDVQKSKISQADFGALNDSEATSPPSELSLESFQNLPKKVKIETSEDSITPTDSGSYPSKNITSRSTFLTPKKQINEPRTMLTPASSKSASSRSRVDMDSDSDMSLSRKPTMKLKTTRPTRSHTKISSVKSVLRAIKTPEFLRNSVEKIRETEETEDLQLTKTSKEFKSPQQISSETLRINQLFEKPINNKSLENDTYSDEEEENRLKTANFLQQIREKRNQEINPENNSTEKDESIFVWEQPDKNPEWENNTIQSSNNIPVGIFKSLPSAMSFTTTNLGSDPPIAPFLQDILTNNYEPDNPKEDKENFAEDNEFSSTQVIVSALESQRSPCSSPEIIRTNKPPIRSSNSKKITKISLTPQSQSQISKTNKIPDKNQKPNPTFSDGFFEEHIPEEEFEIDEEILISSPESPLQWERIQRFNTTSNLPALSDKISNDKIRRSETLANTGSSNLRKKADAYKYMEVVRGNDRKQLEANECNNCSDVFTSYISKKKKNWKLM